MMRLEILQEAHKLRVENIVVVVEAIGLFLRQKLMLQESHLYVGRKYNYVY